MDGQSYRAAPEAPSNTPLGGPLGACPKLLEWHRACPIGFRLAEGLDEPLSVDLPPGVLVDVSVDELKEAAGLQRMAGVLLRPSSDTVVRAGSTFTRAKHGKTRTVLLIGTRDAIQLETIYARLASVVELWPLEMERAVPRG